MSLEYAPVAGRDFDVIWPVVEPMLTAGDAFALANDYHAARAMWCAPHRQAFAVMDDGDCIGAYFFGANQQGAGDHVANAGYVVAQSARGRGLAKAMCLHSLDQARAAGFLAMQFNMVVSTNETAIRAWKACGFAIVGTLPEAFRHPRLGLVDAYVMYRKL